MGNRKSKPKSKPEMIEPRVSEPKENSIQTSNEPEKSDLTSIQENDVEKRVSEPKLVEGETDQVINDRFKIPQGITSVYQCVINKKNAELLLKNWFRVSGEEGIQDIELELYKPSLNLFLAI